MNNEIQFTKDSLEAAHEIGRTVRTMDNIIRSLRTLGIPAGEDLLIIRNHIADLAEECADHLMKEQHQQLLDTQDQTWNLVGAVFADAAEKIKLEDK